MSVAALLVSGLVVPVLPFLVIPLLGFVAVGVAGAVDKVGLALALTAGALALVAVLAGARRRWTVTVLIALAAVVISGPAALLLESVDDTPDAVDGDTALAVPRPLPASASPLEVVLGASRVAGEGGSSDARAVCGLLAPAARGSCRPGDVSTVEEGELILARQDDTRAVVLYGRSATGFLSVRLERSERGWELLELPTTFGPDACVREAVQRGEDPFSCDVADG